MRIVGGRHKGRALTAPQGMETRPTSDRARESLFNILAHSGETPLQGARVLDAFAGSGALGFEALSRGAAQAIFLDTAPAALSAIRANAATLKESPTILRVDATNPPPAPAACDLVFLDAPYNKTLSEPALASLAAKGWIAPDAACIVEVAAREDFFAPPGFEEWDRRSYGAAKVIFLRWVGV
ncbi:16S rRNA (guanine(966)-N(2))-methyltransferase RsmD [Telmatospirillum sp. J64-1]|uniref:16S rRNA (guanine(966)-N(2))-methyltransferase RsmD n=1 Tax=Telmatospirillum sp. J64-1 TaxID=2502183 RepID=UPI00115E9AA1|nr:16S rRNA (guanine(966)-N(2))-methyltransferase RsmD [Telmatospirillum sp. J64-1]